MEQIEFKNACTEVLEILKYIRNEDIKRIPKEEIENLEHNANKDYIFTYDINKTIKEQNVSKMANGIIAIFFTDYIATSKQKEIIKKRQRKYEEVVDNKKKELYNPDNIFGNRNKAQNETTEIVNMPVVIEKKSIFREIMDFLKGICKRK